MHDAGNRALDPPIVDLDFLDSNSSSDDDDANNARALSPAEAGPSSVADHHISPNFDVNKANWGLDAATTEDACKTLKLQGCFRFCNTTLHN